MNKFILLLVGVFASLYVHAQIIPGSILWGQPDVYSLKLSPDTTYFSTEFNDEDQYVIAVTDTKTMVTYSLIRLLKEDGGYFSDHYWVDNDTLFLTYKAKKNYRFANALLHFKIVNDQAQVDLKLIKAKGEIVGTLENEDNMVLFGVKEKGKWKEQTKLYKASAESLQNDELSEEDRYQYELKNAIDYFYDEDSKVLYATTYYRKKVHYWYLLPSESKWNKMLELNEDMFDFEIIGPLGKGKLAVLSNENTDLNSLYEYDIKSQTIGRLLYQHDNYDLTGASVDPKTGTVKSVSFYENGRFTEHFVSDPDTDFYRLMKDALDGRQFVTVSSKDGFDKKIIFARSSSEIGKYYLADSKMLTAEELMAKSEDLYKYPMTKSEVFTVTNELGQEVEAFLTRPKNNNGVLLVNPHGGPIGVREYDDFNREVQYFASRGFSVLRVNFRGSKGYGKKFQKQGVGEFGKGIEADISAAVKQVRNKYRFNKMCSIGASYGGYSAIMLAITKPKDYDCVVASYGIYDLPLMFNQSNRELEEDRQKRVENALGEMRDELWDVSPLYFIEKLKAPLLLIAGKEDKVAHYEHSNRLKYRLKQLGADFEYLAYESAGHGHGSYRFGWRHEAAYTDDFLRRTLKLPALESENAKDIIREENLIMADGFDSEEFLEPDEEKAYRFYLKAAELEDTRAQFNVGAYYHRGEYVEKDYKKAEFWYLKASRAGNEKATYRLGEMYEDGVLGQESRLKAYAMYQKADEQEHELAYLKLAKLECLGLGVEQNIDYCFEELDLRGYVGDKKGKKYKRIKDVRDSIVTGLTWSEEFSSDAKAKIIKSVTELYDIDTIDVSVDDGKEGYYVKKLWRNVPNLYTSEFNYSLEVPAQKNINFGSSLAFESDDYDEKDKTMVKYRWIPPKGLDEEGNPREPINYTFSLNLEEEAFFNRTITEEWEMDPGEWKLEVYTLDDKKLYEQVFQIYKEV